MSKINIKEMLGILKKAYEESMPFNKHLGVKINTLTLDEAVIKIEMKDELLRDKITGKGVLHGGVISSVLDLTGGVIAQLSVLKSMADSTPEQLGKKLLQMGTIDLRIDYIRPGKGKYFLATGNILRLGKKVAVARTTLHNDEDILIAAGTGTYIVG